MVLTPRTLTQPSVLSSHLLSFLSSRIATWSRQHHSFLEVHACYAPVDHRGEECPPHVYHGCQFVDCWETFSGPCIGCFCRVKYSVFSSTCMCWTPPRSLFIVCRNLYEDSLVVFYPGTSFVVHDYKPPLGVYSSPLLAASMFFTGVIPERCLPTRLVPHDELG